MQRYTVYFIWKLLYMFQVVPSLTRYHLLLCVFNEIWCELPEYRNNAETCSSLEVERIYRYQNCAFVGVTRVLIYHMARKEQCKSPLLHFPLYSVKHKWELLVTVILLNEFNVYGSVHCNNILIYIQQYATLHSLFYLETALHVSGGTIIDEASFIAVCV